MNTDEGNGVPEEDVNKNAPGTGEDRSRGELDHARPVLLTLLCLFSFVFYGLLSVIFLMAMFLSGWITRVRNIYLPESAESGSAIILVTSAGFLLHMVSLVGTIYMWNMKKTGFLMLAISSLIISLYQLLSGSMSVFTTTVYIVFIVLFGIFYRKFS